VDFADANHGLIAAGSEVMRTTNGGINWTLVDVSPAQLQGVSFPTRDVGAVVGAVSTNLPSKGVYRSENGGVSWNEQTSGVGSGIVILAVSFVDALIGTAVAPGLSGSDKSIIIRTINGGASWSPQDSGTTELLLDVCSVSAQIGTAVGTGGTILRTENGGATWTAQTSGTNDLFYAVSFIDASVGTVVGDNGTILHTTDGGVTWEPQASGITKDLFGVSIFLKQP